MKFIPKIFLLLFLLCSTAVLSQTPGFNYQALILNTEELQIPGTNIEANKIPLVLEDVTLRFSITNVDGTEYIEEHTITTDENGMVSVIVGEGTPISATFDQINWDGNLKYLNVELNILADNEGFIFLDAQKILYIPHPTNGTSHVAIVNSLDNLTPPYTTGDLIWMNGPDENPTLLIWDGTNWVPVSNDYDPTNELGLLVVANAADREAQFPTPQIGDQVWNQTCGCIEVFDGSSWVSGVSRNIDALNGLYKDGTSIKLGGTLIEPTEIITSVTNTFAIKNLEESISTDDKIVIVEENTGILRTKSLSSVLQQEQIIITATEGQLRFSTPQLITNSGKIDVYRNGVRIEFTTIDASTIEIEPEAICYANDRIRIVQLY